MYLYGSIDMRSIFVAEAFSRSSFMAVNVGIYRNSMKQMGPESTCPILHGFPAEIAAGVTSSPRTSLYNCFLISVF